MATPHQYYEDVIGRGFDEDGVYGVQCVDGFKHFCRTQLGYNISHTTICNPTGFATSIWDNFDSLGLGRFFDKVPSNQMVDGDWAIWSYDKNNRSCPYSHVAMFRKDNGNGTGVFLGQNQSGTRAYTQRNIYYDGLRGGMRPKMYHEGYKTGVYKCLYNMKVRSGAGLQYKQVKVCDLTVDGKAHATSQSPNANAVYKAGTLFTARTIIKNDTNNSIWAKSPSGYICLADANQKYCDFVE